MTMDIVNQKKIKRAVEAGEGSMIHYPYPILDKTFAL